MEPSKTSRIVSFSLLIAIILVIGALFFKVMATFLVPLFLAALCLVMFRPLHVWILRRCRERQHLAGVGGVLGLVIYLVVQPVSWFLIPSEVGKMFRQDGQEAPFSGWTGLWLLLPIIGAFVWFIKVQGALNRYWETKAGAAAPIEPAPMA